MLVVLEEGLLVELDGGRQPAERRDGVAVRRDVALDRLRGLRRGGGGVLQRGGDEGLHVDDLVFDKNVTLFLLGLLVLALVKLLHLLLDVVEEDLAVDGARSHDVGVRGVEVEAEDLERGLQHEDGVDRVDVLEVPEKDAELVALKLGRGALLEGEVLHEGGGHDVQSEPELGKDLLAGWNWMCDTTLPRQLSSCVQMEQDLSSLMEVDISVV